jgi:hypothetical protein
MNLDDFLVPNSIASPAGITPSPDERSSAVDHAHPSTMPIQSRKVTSHPSTESLPVSSVPQAPTVSNRNGEFNYVPRRLRKTSIDERRVSHMPHNPRVVCLQRLIVTIAPETTCRFLSSRPADDIIESTPRCRPGYRDARLHSGPTTKPSTLPCPQPYTPADSFSARHV